MKNLRKPVVMTLSGHDPSGGAGIQADIEAIHALGGHATSVITCLTRQDTNNVYEIQPVDADSLLRQAETLLADMTIDAFKIGLIGNLENVNAIEAIIRQHADIPVVLDPVLAAGGGKNLSSADIAQAICKQLLPLTTIITPNIPEAYALSGSQNTQESAEFFYQTGCLYALITGTHADTSDVINELYEGKNLIASSSWPRLAETYHGSGCTLASAIAALLASGKLVSDAVSDALKFTWESLENATPQGKGQLIPGR